MATKLKAIKPKSVEPSKVKLTGFGGSGVGKTFFALSLPNAFYMDCENGASRAHYTDILEKSGAMYFGIEQGAGDFNEVIEQVKALATEKHEYKTLVIDSITKLFNNEVAKEMERLGDKDAFGASKKPAIAKMRQLLNWVDRLDMNVVMVAHEAKEWSGDKQIGVKPDVWEKLIYELDLVLHIKKQGNSRKAYVVKSRLLGFPDGDSFELSYDEFAKRYGKDIIEGEVKVLKLATAEQVREVTDLLERWKQPDGFVEKCHSKAKAENWGDYDSEKLQSVIDYIKGQLTTKGEVK